MPSMLRIVFAIVIFLIAASPWVYLMLFGGMSGNNAEQTQQLEQYRQDLIVARQESTLKDRKITELEAEITTHRSKLQFLEDNILKAETSRDEALRNGKVLNEQLQDLRDELTDVENRLLEETNRANTLEQMNEAVAARLDASVQEVRRLQTIIRTLSNSTTPSGS